MDLYTGTVAPENQIHDFNPGIAESGLFWTIAVPDSAVKVNLREAKASMRVSTDAVEDYGNIVNALKDGPSLPASASFHIMWRGNQGTQHVVDPVNRFVSDVIYDSAKMEWRARRSDGFRFVSDPTSTSFSLFAQLAHERNGVFFSE